MSAFSGWKPAFSDDGAATELYAEPEQVIADAWEAGELSWKLDPHQLEIYDLFYEWNARRQTPEYAAFVVETGASLDDVWVEELARRFGKTAKWILMLDELAIRRQGAVYTYATAFQKDIGDIIVPLANQLHGDAPESVCPRYQRSKNEGHEGLYYPNGSVVKLVGIDQHPDALRGRFSDGVVISEAGFVKQLEDTVRSVLLPQFQRRPWAFLALESSTPKQIDHDFARVFVPDAKLRGAYVKRTIDANVAISEVEKARAIRQAGGRGHPTCEREYYCEPTRDPEQTVLPEFDEAKHVVAPSGVPDYAHAYVSVDPGIRDLLAIVWGYWDFDRAKLVVQRSWAERNANTSRVADVIKSVEREIWHGGEADAAELKYWNGRELKQNPYLRVSDTDARLIRDLTMEHGVRIIPTAKDDAEAQLYALRNAFLADKIEIWEGSGPLADHCKAAMWNDKRTDWERSEINGHADALAALIYMWRNIVRTLNPHMPAQAHPGDPETFVRPGLAKPERHMTRKLNEVFGGNRGRVRLKGRVR